MELRNSDRERNAVPASRGSDLSMDDGEGISLDEEREKVVQRQGFGLSEWMSTEKKIEKFGECHVETSSKIWYNQGPKC